MNKIIQSVKVITLVSILFTLAACVTESESGPFKKPTPEDKQHAISLYVQIAFQYLEAKDYERAMASVKRGLDLDEKSPIALNALAVVYQYQGDTDKAHETFKKALRQDDKFSQGHLSYGQFLYQQKEYAEACKQFQFAANDDFYEKRSLAYYHLATCYKAQGDTSKSEAALGRSVGLDPSFSPGLLALSALRFEQKAFPESKELFDSYVEKTRANNQILSADALWLGIRLERVFGNQDAEASWALQLKNNYPYSKEYLDYQDSLKK